MKVGMLAAMCLLTGASIVYPAITSGQIDKDLEPTLRVLVRVSTPIPSLLEPPVPFYTAFPDPRGDLIDGTGNSTFVRGWFRQMRQVIPEYLKQDERLRQHVDVF